MDNDPVSRWKSSRLVYECPPSDSCMYIFFISRKRMYVILLHNKHAPEALLLCAHEHYDFHTLLTDLPSRALRDELEEEAGEKRI